MPSEVFDVITVGCSAAEIGAAIELKKLNPSVNYLILKGHDRLSGRSWTDRQTFGEEIPFDLCDHYLCHHEIEENHFLEYGQRSDRDRIEFDVYGISLMSIYDED
jgi:monoamine oxidase